MSYGNAFAQREGDVGLNLLASPFLSRVRLLSISASVGWLRGGGRIEVVRIQLGPRPERNTLAEAFVVVSTVVRLVEGRHGGSLCIL